MFLLESKTIAGSGSFCCVIALEYSLSFSNLSEEPSLHPVSTQRKENEISTDDLLIGSYLSCLYEKEWYDGVVEEVSIEKNDAVLRINAGCQ